MDGTDDDSLWNGIKEDGHVRSVRKMKALTLKMETVTLTGKCRGEFRPRQTRQLPRAVDLKGRLLSCQSY